LVQRIIDMGFRPDMIRDRGDYFVVEGDIVIWKRDLQPSVGSVPNNNPFRPQFQWSTYQLVQFEQAQNIVVAISPSVSSGWAEAVRAAMAEWDSVPGIALHFVEGSPANITIQQTLIDQGLTCARATFPTSNGPGNLITVNSWFATSLPAPEKLLVMTHEFGHTVGFRHTNWQSLHESAEPPGALLIGHTPQTDDASVMNGNTCGYSWGGFSSWDIEAVRVLYPALPIITITGSLEPGQYFYVNWTRIPGATGYFEKYQYCYWSYDQDGNPIWVCAAGGTVDSDTSWGPMYSTGDYSCQARAIIGIVFAADTVFPNTDADGVDVPTCTP